MRVLIYCAKQPTRRYLVNLLTDSLIDEIKGLINSRKHSQAVITAFYKGSIEKEVSEEDLANVEVDLILSEKSARWDLCA
jgi:hypothetical protein